MPNSGFELRCCVCIIGIWFVFVSLCLSVNSESIINDLSFSDIVSQLPSNIFLWVWNRHILVGLHVVRYFYHWMQLHSRDKTYFLSIVFNFRLLFVVQLSLLSYSCAVCVASALLLLLCGVSAFPDFLEFRRFTELSVTTVSVALVSKSYLLDALKDRSWLIGF